MSNVGRPRTGLKPCPFDGSKERDSNGQCACRNARYRLLRGAPKSTAEKAGRHYDKALKSKKTIEKALADTREEYPSLAAKARKAPADRKAPAKKAQPSKGKATPKPEVDVVEEAVEKVAPERYWLIVQDDWTDKKAYARKDAAIKNGVRSGEAWTVEYKGKVVASSEDV